MAAIGNFFLILSLIAFFLLNTGAMAKAPPHNDGAVGYYWGLMILNAAFAIFMSIATLIIGYKGGFDWVGNNRSNRVLIVSVVFVCILFVTVMSSLLKHENGPVPFPLRQFASFVPILFPLVLIVCGFIMLNTSVKATVPTAVYTWPTMIVGLIAVIGTVSAGAGWAAQSFKQQAAALTDSQNRIGQNEQRILNQIDTADVSKSIYSILIFSGHNQPDFIWTKCVDKIKTNPEWQQKLVEILRGPGAPEAFQFLAYNPVDDEGMFLEPVSEGVLQQGHLIRESIRNANHPSNYYDGQFGWETERVIHTLDRFDGKGMDYLPAMKEFRKAFDEHSPYTKPKWKCIKLVDKWIEKHEGKG